MNPQHQRHQIKRMSLTDIQATLRAESGTPNKPGDRVISMHWLRRFGTQQTSRKAQSAVIETI
jgi:hypothetical protein